MAKSPNPRPVVLAGISIGLLVAGWLMKPFPILIFVGLAPLFAISDQASGENRFWNLSELILVALCAAVLAAHIFDLQLLVISLLEAIALTLSFLAYSFCRERRGAMLGKLNIVLFWLAIEFGLLNLPWRNQFVFLADSLILKTTWFSWTQYTGYLGVSFWILMSNLFLYNGLFRDGKANVGWLVFTVLWITMPIVFSFWSGGQAISRAEMISMYAGKNSLQNENYIRFQEVIPAAASGISVLALLVAVLNKNDKK